MGLTLEREGASVPAQDSEMPRRRLWTEDEYQRLLKAGFLDGHYELIEGEILETMPADPPHILAIKLLTNWLFSLFGVMYVRQEAGIRLPGIATRPEPDAAVTREEAVAYGNRLPEPSDLVMVAEVSDSTFAYDRKTKARLYGQKGIPEYWLLDLNGRRLFLHRQPGAQGYAAVQEFAETAEVSLLAKPEASVTVGSLLPPPA